MRTGESVIIMVPALPEQFDDQLGFGARFPGAERGLPSSIPQ
jgi:hypothetical protein